jgi:hypothetical protein
MQPLLLGRTAAKACDPLAIRIDGGNFGAAMTTSSGQAILVPERTALPDSVCLIASSLLALGGPESPGSSAEACGSRWHDRSTASECDAGPSMGPPPAADERSGSAVIFWNQEKH